MGSFHLSSYSPTTTSAVAFSLFTSPSDKTDPSSMPATRTRASRPSGLARKQPYWKPQLSPGDLDVEEETGAQDAQVVPEGPAPLGHGPLALVVRAFMVAVLLVGGIHFFEFA